MATLDNLISCLTLLAVLVCMSGAAFAQAPDTAWTRMFGGSQDDYGESIQQTSDGGYVVVGYTTSFGVRLDDVYLIKIDVNGDTLFTKTFGGSGNDLGFSIQQTIDGGYIIAGATSSFGAGTQDVYLIKTDASGDTLFTKTFGGIPEDFANSVQQTSDGGYIILGTTYSFGHGNSDIYLIKTDANGDTLFTKTFGGSNRDYGNSVHQTSDGGYIITGWTYSYGAGDEDGYLIKTDVNGGIIFSKTFGGIGADEVHSVQQTNDGGYIITGFTNSFGAGGIDVYLIKTNAGGDTVFTKTFGGINDDYGRSVQQTRDGGYIITGITNSFGAGSNDIYIIKTDPNGNSQFTKTIGGSSYDESQSVQQTSDGGYITAGYTNSFGSGNSDVYLIKLNPEQQFTESFPNTLPNLTNSTAAWGDYDNDGNLDVLICGFDGTNPVTKLYQNTGSGFTEVFAGTFTNVSSGSVAWGDYDNDGNLDIVLTGWNGSVPVSKIYHNKGSGSGFTKAFSGNLTGVINSAVAWGDYDNDGDLDILLTGSSNNDNTLPVSKIYQNTGAGFTEVVAGSLPGVFSCSVAWGDYDNDGKLDFIVAGDNAQGQRITQLYHNTGSGFSEVFPGSIVAGSGSSVAWGDYDNDGDLDLLVTGTPFSGVRAAKVYQNTGSGFTEVFAGNLDEVFIGSAVWGDYDNDGDLDILLTGSSAGGAVSKIYQNTGSGFTEVFAGTLPSIQSGAAVWGDYDNDGDLDILITGSGISKIYQNNGTTFNTAPGAPNGLSAIPSGHNVTFSWNRGTDGQTPQNGLTYNLRIGALPNGISQVSPMANVSTGYRRVVQIGNASSNTSWTLTNLPYGKYYWSVQSIDGNFAGSPFATEGIVILAPNAAPHLVAYYPFTNGSSNDSSGYENNGITTGTTITPDRFGNDFDALYFDGTNSSVAVGSNPSLNPVNEMTVVTWCMWDGNGSPDGFILSKGQDISGESQYEISKSANGKFRPHIHIGGALRYDDGATTVQSNVWYNLAMTYNDTAMKLYVNGILDITIPITGTIDTTPYPLSIGSRANDNGLKFSGKIDDIHIYNKALSVTQIDSLYHLGGWGISPVISLSRENIPFGDVIITANKQDSLVITNTGNADLTVSNIACDNSHFVPDATAFTLTPNESKTVRVTFTPDAGTGPYGGTIYITHNASGSPSSVSVSGNGVPVPVPVYNQSRNDIPYGLVTVNQSKVDSFVVTNTGTADLSVTGITSDNPAFVMDTTNFLVAPNASKKIRVTFTPTTAQGYSGTISIAHNATGSPATITISGTGTDEQLPVISITPNNLNYGPVIINQIKKDSITVSNTGTADLIISGITCDKPEYIIDSTSFTVSPASSKIVHVTFTPTAVISYNGNISIAHNAAGSPSAVAVSGIGINEAAPVISLSRSSIPFGTVLVDSTKRDSITVTNTGTAVLTVSSIASDNAAFTVDSSSLVVQPDESKTIHVSFAPTASQQYNANLTFTHNAAGSPNTVTLSGNGTTTPFPVLSLSRRNVPFGVVLVDSSKKDSIIITNTGTAQLDINSITSGNGAFTVVPTNFSIPASESRTVKITFIPTSASTYNSHLIITHNAETSPDTVFVSGTGSNTAIPALTLSRTSIAFGKVLQDSSKQDSVIFTNTGIADLVVSDILCDNNSFLANPFNFTLTPNESKTVIITFTPPDTVFFDRHFTITHNAASRPDTISVSGKGTMPEIFISRPNINFPNTLLGMVIMDTVDIYNLGTGPLNISDITSSNTAFFIGESPNFSIPSNQHHVLHIGFGAPSEGDFYGTIILNHNAPGNPDTVYVQGRGITPRISISRHTFSFDSVVVGSRKTDSLAIGNTGSATLNITSLESNNAAFIIDSSSLTIEPGITRKVKISFAPTSAFSYNGKIGLSFNTPETPDSIMLTGIGIAPVIAVSDDSLSFTTVMVGSESIDTLVVSNSGQAELILSHIAINDTSFYTDTTSKIVTPGNSVNIVVHFNPQTSGNHSGILTLTHNAGVASSISLQGSSYSVIAGGVSSTTGRFSAGIPAKEWALMSVPYTPDNSLHTTFSAQLPGSGKTKVFTLQNGQYRDVTAETTPYQITTAFWLKTVVKSSSFDLNFGAGTLFGNETFTKTIPTGWSFIGSPFYPQEASWSPVNTQAGTSGIRVYKYSHESTSWEGPLDPTVEKLQPFGGYAVWNGTPGAALFTFIRGTSPAPYPEFQNGDGWDAVLSIGKATMRIGQHKKAKDAVDAYDYPMAPANPDAKNDAPYLAGKLWSDIRANTHEENLPLKWKVYINPKTSHILRVKELQNFPEGWKIVIQGIPLTTQRELNGGDSIMLSTKITTPFVAEIIAGPEELVNGEIPLKYSLFQNYPNPFNPSTTISFTIAGTERNASLKIYDVLGREVMTLFNGTLEKGSYNFVWEGSNNAGERIGSGIYFARLSTKGYTKNIKMNLLK